jgi:hypothetical protein
MPVPGGLESCLRYEEGPDKELKEGQPVGVFCEINMSFGDRLWVVLPTAVRREVLRASKEDLFILGQRFPEDQKLAGVLRAAIVKLFPGDEKIAIEIPDGRTHVVEKNNLFVFGPDGEEEQK